MPSPPIRRRHAKTAVRAELREAVPGATDRIGGLALYLQTPVIREETQQSPELVAAVAAVAPPHKMLQVAVAAVAAVAVV